LEVEPCGSKKRKKSGKRKLKKKRNGNQREKHARKILLIFIFAEYLSDLSKESLPKV